MAVKHSDATEPRLNKEYLCMCVQRVRKCHHLQSCASVHSCYCFDMLLLRDYKEKVPTTLQLLVLACA